MTIFFLEIDAKDHAQNDGGHDDAHDAQRVRAGVGDGDVFALIAQHVERFLSGAQARRVGDGTVMHAEHLRQRHGVLQAEVDRNGDRNAQHHGEDREQIELQAAAFKRREKGRSYLQADEKDKQDESEVAHEVEHREVHGDACVAQGQRNEQHEGYAQGNAEYLEAAERHADGNDDRIDKQNVADGIGIRQKLC